MKATDLKIGSQYHSVTWNKPVELTAEDIYELVSRADGASISHYIDEMFEPIPLTAAWLEYFGFEYLDSVTELWGFQGHCFSWRTGDFSRKDGSSIKDGKLYHFINGQPVLNRKPLEFVHEIQNLIFALTGEELSLNHPSK